MNNTTNVLISTYNYSNNASIRSEIVTGSFQFKINIYISYLVISVIGILGNSVTIFLMMKSRTLRKSTVNILLINQSIIDLVVCIVTLVWIPVDYYVQDYRRYRSVHWCFCFFVYSQFFIAYTTCVSSYNLGLISMERCFSILAPVSHRLHSTKPRLYVASTLLWVYCLALMLAYTLPINGIRADGGCHFWSNFSSRIRAQIFSVSLLFGYNAVPVVMMTASYMLIYRSIADKLAVKEDHRMKLIKMLATCVLAYIVCHVVRCAIDIYSRFYNFNLRTPAFFVG